MAKKSFKHKLEVKFGTTSNTGDATRIGVSISCTKPRKKGMLEIVDELFSGSQLEVELLCDPNADEDADGQLKFEADGERKSKEGDVLSVKGTPTAARYSGSNDHFQTTLVFPDAGAVYMVLGCFAKHPGKLLCTRIGAAKPQPDDDGEEE